MCSSDLPAFGAGEMLAERDFVFAVPVRKAAVQADEAEFAAAEIERGFDFFIVFLVVYLLNIL